MKDKKKSSKKKLFIYFFYFSKNGSKSKLMRKDSQIEREFPNPE